jgi:hypothetical protein
MEVLINILLYTRQQESVESRCPYLVSEADTRIPMTVIAVFVLMDSAAVTVRKLLSQPEVSIRSRDNLKNVMTACK